MELELLAISAIIIAVSIYIYYIRRRVPKAKEPSSFFNTEEKPTKVVGSNPTSPSSKNSWFGGWKPRRVGNKIKIPGLLTFKRVIAGFLFLVHGIFFLMLLRYPAPMSDYYAFAIFLTCFILLDYLFKTRRGE